MVGSSILRTLPSGYTPVIADKSELNLIDTSTVEKFLKASSVDTVILAAAKVGGIRANSKNQYEFLIQNLKIQNSVIEAAYRAQIKQLVFLGSSCIYPRYSQQPINEAQLLGGPLEETNTGYALAKIAGLHLCRYISEKSGFNYFTLMPTNLYGPNDNYDYETSHVAASLMRKFHEAKLLGLDVVEVWGTGLPLREFMHVDDLASSIFYFLEHSNKESLINVGTGMDISIREFSKLMARITGFSGKIRFNSEMPDGTPRKLLDISKAKHLGWEPKIGLELGLKQTYEWFTEAYEKGAIRGI